MSLRPSAASSIPCALLVVAALVGTSPARAEDPDIERARALFDQAGELERQGQWAGAQEKLRGALRIRETPHLRYALGWALENDDKLLEAKTEYETASRLAQRTGAEDVGRLSTMRLAELERKTPLVQVRVPNGAAAGARVIVDGRTTALQNDVVTVPVNPGSRVVRIERNGRPSTEQLVYVSRGSLQVVEDAPDESVASRNAAQERHNAAAEANAAATPGHSGASKLPIVLVAGGAALAVTGGILFIASASDAADRDASMQRWCAATACTNGTTATLPETSEAAAQRREAFDAADRGNTKQIIGGVVGGVGLVGAAVGTYMLLHGERGRDERVHVGAAPLPGGGMASAALRF